MRALHDGHGRSVRYLRLSVTDRCNLRCLYCRSNAKQRCIPHEQVLRYEEMARMVGIAASLGIGKVRLTGGEPFARKGCGQFLAMLHARFPDMDLRVTTNGTLLEPHIPLLRRIGVSAVNLSLDSFDRETFARVTGRDLLPPVLAALDGLLDFARRTGTPLVLATTGYTPEQVAQIGAAALEVPIFRSANMSLGINVLLELVKKAASVLGDSYDIEIVERHHRRKVDAPSGTALMIADAAASACGHETEYVFERHSVRQPRDKKEIGISAVRGGTIVGEHEIIFAGHDEVMEIRHTALSREIFAQGAVEAAKFMAGVKAPGLYDMSSLIR